MAPRKPNYSFERHERDRAKAAKLAQKAEAKRQQRELDRAGPESVEHGGAPTDSVPDSDPA